jgi:hypothetical protein
MSPGESFPYYISLYDTTGAVLLFPSWGAGVRVYVWCCGHGISAISYMMMLESNETGASPSNLPSLRDDYVCLIDNELDFGLDLDLKPFHRTNYMLQRDTPDPSI